MKKYFFIIFGLASCLFSHATETLVVSYATTHLNQVPDSIIGTLITPSGEVFQTDLMGPFDHCNLIINSPEIGTYQSYFEVAKLGCFRLCPIVGGIGVLLCHHPEKTIPIIPKESRIQTFPSGKAIQIGSISQPLCTFQITQEDLN